MKKNDKRIDRVYSFFNAIRGNNTPNEYQSVLAVLKKLMVLQDCAQNEMDYDELYQLMESVATDFEIPAASEGFGEISKSLREELVGIQTGTVEDRHGWMTRLV